MFSDVDLEKMKNIDIKSVDVNDLKYLYELGKLDLNVPLAERLEYIKGFLGNPYAFKSKQGIKVKISHRGIKTIDEILIEHFINNL